MNAKIIKNTSGYNWNKFVGNIYPVFKLEKDIGYVWLDMSCELNEHSILPNFIIPFKLEEVEIITLEKVRDEM